MAELQRMLQRRQQIVEGEADPVATPSSVFNPHTEFPEFSRKEIQNYQKTFRKYDEDHSGKIDFEELKRMMEKLGHPQTHIQLRQMIQQIDEDGDNEINFREFLLIFRKSRAGELGGCEGLAALAATASVDVSEVGVGGAKAFFEAKSAESKRGAATEAEIKAEQEVKRQERAEAAVRKAAFKAKMEAFNSAGST